MEDWSAYIAHEREVVRRLGEQRETRRALLTERAQALAKRLAALGARRVWVFGSVAHGRLHRKSDLDLAVEGVSLSQDQLLAVAESLEPYLPVDIVAMERAEPRLRERIEREGRLIFEAGRGAQS